MFKNIFIILSVMVLMVLVSCISMESNTDSISFLSPPANCSQVTTTEYLYIYFEDKAEYNIEKHIIIYNEDGSVFEEIDINSDCLYVKKDKSIIINPSNDFVIGNSYYINFDEELFNNGMIIAGKKDWSFTVNTELIHHVIYSEEIGMDFAVPVLLPANYSANKQYPVIFLTDGNRGGYLQFSRFAEAQTNGEIEDVIVVGVGYPESYPIEDVRLFRSRDYRDEADVFYNFLVNKVIPFIDEKYSINTSDRTIIGNSAGGNFAGYTLFQYRENINFPFKNIVAVTPITQLIEEEKLQAAEISDLPINFFLAVGGADREVFHSNFNKIKTQLESRNYPGLQFEYRVIEGQPHGAQSSLPAYKEALKLYYGTN